MGCFIGFFGLRKRNKQAVKATDDPNRELVILGEKAVPDSGDAATRYRKATALERNQVGIKSSLGFDLEDILRSSGEVLGKVTFGTTLRTYYGVVEKVKEFGEKEFGEMLGAIDGINHENLLPLTAYHYSKDEKLLVYDYMPMGSLYALLHVQRIPLNWAIRINIALGAARAIAYIHSQSPTTFHGNIKSSNVLLTKTFEARVSDYGLAVWTHPYCEIYVFV